MKLPRGITGFYRRAEVPPLVDERAFRSVCHAVAMEFGGKVTAIEVPAHSWTHNFLTTQLSLGDRKLTVLLNAHHPYLAFADPAEVGQLSFEFVDWPAGAKQFNRCSEYRVLTTAELAMPLDALDLSALADAELEQIKYWKARELHEILFNDWD